jgi:hypothetical protein
MGMKELKKTLLNLLSIHFCMYNKQPVKLFLSQQNICCCCCMPCGIC